MSALTIPHPLDILIGKLARLDAKDLKAFERVIELTGHPTAEEFKHELQIAVDLFRPAFADDSPNRYPENTRRLWQTVFHAEIDVRRDIIEPAIARRNQGYGEAPPGLQIKPWPVMAWDGDLSASPLPLWMNGKRMCALQTIQFKAQSVRSLPCPPKGDRIGEYARGSQSRGAECRVRREQNQFSRPYRLAGYLGGIGQAIGRLGQSKPLIRSRISNPGGAIVQPGAGFASSFFFSLLSALEACLAASGGFAAAGLKKPRRTGASTVGGASRMVFPA